MFSYLSQCKDTIYLASGYIQILAALFSEITFCGF